MKPIRNLVRFCADELGVASIYMLCLLPLFLMILGLGMDGAAAFRTQNLLQSTADASALAAAKGLPTNSTAITNAFNYATANMSIAGFGNVLNTNQSDIIFGNWNGTAFAPNGKPTNAISVTVRTAAANSNAYPTTFLGLVGKASWDISATAVATTVTPPVDCVLALNTTQAGAIDLKGSASLNAPNCGVAANSSASCPLTTGGSSSVNVKSADFVGNFTIASCSSGSSSMTIPALHTNTNATPDPYSGLVMPSFPACTTSVSVTGSGSQTINPGSYCGISIGGSASLTLNPGIYYIDRGDFSMSGSSTITGNGVTIVLTSSTGSNIGTFSTVGSASLNLTAPNSGTFAGLAVYQDVRAGSGTDSVKGSSTLNVTGVLYFSKQHLDFVGSTSGGPGCLELIADTISFVGSAGLDRSGCTGTGVKNIGLPISILVQ